MNTLKTIFVAALTSMPVAAQDLPGWAYGYPPAGSVASPRAASPTPDQAIKRLPGSDGAFTPAQIRDAFGPADWYPGLVPLEN